MTDRPPEPLDATMVDAPPYRTHDSGWECGMVPPAWRGVGGHLDDPGVRAERGTVRRHRWWAVWLRRIGKACGWVAVAAAAALAGAAVLYLILLTVLCGINPTELL